MLTMKSKNASPAKQLGLLVIVWSIWIIFAFLRLNGTTIEQTLWAEDGVIFINESRRLGVSSIWVPYAGYLHFYPRLVAWATSLFDLQITPLLFFSAWFLAYLGLAAVIVNRASRCGLDPKDIVLLAIVVVAQPHEGEVFFTLTNSQWWIGAALMLYILVPVRDSMTVYSRATLLSASITGPFAILLTPIIFLRTIICRDWNSRRWVYSIVGLCAFVQVAVLLSSNRLENGVFDANVHHWISAVLIFLNFGSDKGIAKIASFFFWGAVGCAFVRSCVKGAWRQNDSVPVVVMSLSAGALLCLASGLLATKFSPQLLSPLGAGARYFFIPYSLIFFASFVLLSGYGKQKYIAYCALIIIIYSSFSVITRENMQYRSFVEFAKRKDDIIIPLNPNWAVYPAWYILAKNAANFLGKDKLNAIRLDIIDARIINADVLQYGVKGFFKATNRDPMVIFDVAGKCDRAKYIGLEVHVNRPNAGWIQVFWTENEDFSEKKSLRRYYPSGDVATQFAMPAANLRYLRFDPQNVPGEFKVNSANLYCL